MMSRRIVVVTFGFWLLKRSVPGVVHQPHFDDHTARRFPSEFRTKRKPTLVARVRHGRVLLGFSQFVHTLPPPQTNFQRHLIYNVG